MMTARKVGAVKKVDLNLSADVEKTFALDKLQKVDLKPTAEAEKTFAVDIYIHGTVFHFHRTNI